MSKAKVELPDGTKVEIEAGTDVIVEIISGLLGPRYNPGTPAAPTKKADTAAPAEEPAVEENLHRRSRTQKDTWTHQGHRTAPQEKAWSQERKVRQDSKKQGKAKGEAQKVI